MAFKIAHSEKVTLAPQGAVMLVHEGCNALVQDRMVFPSAIFMIDGDAEIIYACDDQHGDVVGVLTFKPNPERLSWYVSLGYVEPSSRGSGIYNAMWAALVERAKSKGIRAINSATHVHNKRMLEINAKLNKLPVMVEFEFIV